MLREVTQGCTTSKGQNQDLNRVCLTSEPLPLPTIPYCLLHESATLIISHYLCRSWTSFKISQCLSLLIHEMKMICHRHCIVLNIK